MRLRDIFAEMFMIYFALVIALIAIVTVVQVRKEVLRMQVEAQDTGIIG